MDISKKMHAEHSDKKLFEQAKNYAFDYSNSIAERHVFPSDEAISDLIQFNEDMPSQNGDSSDILEQLHQLGSPATTANTGGRYFGFVTGGILPVTLATKWLTDFWDQNTALQ